MVRDAVVAALVVVWMLTLTACGAPKHDLPYYDRSLYAGAAAPEPTPTPALHWANGSEYAIHIRKRTRTLDVYHRGEKAKEYRVVLGIDSWGRKLYQGDLRTPEGIYRIAAKAPHRRWSRFMLLDYPNADDYLRYQEAEAHGDLPVIDGRPPGIGGEIGIHGTDRIDSNERGLDWTLGCVSLLNHDVDELYRMVPVGTPVLIEK